MMADNQPSVSVNVSALSNALAVAIQQAAANPGSHATANAGSPAVPPPATANPSTSSTAHAATGGPQGSM